MEKIKIGKYAKTHGIKGEIKVKSNFLYKERVFKKGKIVYLNDTAFVIASYRKHQEYDMLTFEGITNINDILPYKGSFLYVDRESISLEEGDYLDSDLLNFSVYMKDKLIGVLTDILPINEKKKLLLVDNHYIPFELIQKIDFKNKKILVEEVEGLL